MEEEGDAVLLQGAGVGGAGLLEAAVTQQLVEGLQVVGGGGGAGEDQGVALQKLLQGLGEGSLLAGGAQGDQLLIEAGAIGLVVHSLHVQAVPLVGNLKFYGLPVDLNVVVHQLFQVLGLEIQIEQAGVQVGPHVQIHVDRGDGGAHDGAADAHVHGELHGGLVGDHAVAAAHRVDDLCRVFLGTIC